MKKKYILISIIIGGAAIILAALLLRNPLYKDIDYKAKKFIKEDINSSIDDFLINDDIYTELAKIATDEEVDEKNIIRDNQNILNKDEGYPSYGLSLIKDDSEKKVWEEEKEKAYIQLNSIFTGGEIQKGSEKIVVNDGVIYYSFTYLAPNKNKYNAYMNMLCDLFRDDYFKLNSDIEYTLDIEVETIAKGNMMAMQLLTSEYFEVSEIPVNVHIVKEADGYKIKNLASVIGLLDGSLDKNFDMNTEESARKNFEKMEKEVMDIYQKAIDDGIYSPSKPLQPLNISNEKHQE